MRHAFRAEHEGGMVRLGASFGHEPLSSAGPRGASVAHVPLRPSRLRPRGCPRARSRLALV